MPAPPQKQTFNRLIADDLRSRILAGVYPVGSLLPTESALALEYATNRNTLREAVRILETQGFLTARQGEGVRVVDFRRHPSIELIGYLLAKPQPTADIAGIVLDLLELRRMLASQIVRRAAGNLSDETVLEIRTLLRGLLPGTPEAERTEGDRRVLELLVRSTGSLVYTALFNSIYRVIADGAAATPALTILPDDYVAQMERVVRHLVAGNAHAADKAMRALCEASDAVLLRSYQKSMEKEP